MCSFRLWLSFFSCSVPRGHPVCRLEFQNHTICVGALPAKQYFVDPVLGNTCLSCLKTLTTRKPQAPAIENWTDWNWGRDTMRINHQQYNNDPNKKYTIFVNRTAVERLPLPSSPLSPSFFASNNLFSAASATSPTASSVKASSTTWVASPESSLTATRLTVASHHSGRARPQRNARSDQSRIAEKHRLHQNSRQCSKSNVKPPRRCCGWRALRTRFLCESQLAPPKNIPLLPAHCIAELMKLRPDHHPCR